MRSSSDSARLITVRWLLRLRWVAIAALGALLVAGLFGAGPRWPLAVPAVALTLGVASTLALHARERRAGGLGDGPIAAALVLDSALLTALFASSGGEANPFALLYLFPVILGSLAVRPTLSWLLLAVTTVAYASLFQLAPAPLHIHDPKAMRLHLLGMFAAYVLAGALMVFAVGRLRVSKDEADARIARARELEAQQRQLAALATLAAGAAHELATPLSTILIATRELERRAAAPRDLEDLALVREEIGRCQEVLTQLSAGAGEGVGEMPADADTRALLERALEGFREDHPIVRDADGAPIRVPTRLVEQVLRRLVDNACDASAPDAEVTVSARVHQGALTLEVRDKGAGMPAERLARVGEPFFTTRADQGGKGLGLYFVRSVAEQLGGALELDSTVGVGTTARVRLPARIGDAP
ncbi:MAG: HAMP domain-containing histidine kinase [Alphaproteobacteria bacterium]|nr:HAMP domain-containing histidine kinase [Alphaproteobacteria bacterium]